MNDEKCASLPEKFFSDKATSSSQAIREKELTDPMDCLIVKEDAFLICLYRALNCVALKSLPYKTQVFAVINDYLSNYIVRNRSSHTLEVVAIAMRIAKIFGLNVTLVEAIALLHDVGHLPFGHLGEQEFSSFTGKEMRHNIIATVLLQKVENFGKGLNLSRQVLEGIFYHSAGADDVIAIENISLEQQLVRIADKIAYVFSDCNDSIRVNGKLPKELQSFVSSFGANRQERIDTCIHALFKESCANGYINLASSDVGQRFQELKRLLYKKIYARADKDKDKQLLRNVLGFIKNNQDMLPIDYELFFTLMTDKDCKGLNRALNKERKVIEARLKKMAAMEIGCNLPKNFSSLDLTKPVLF